MSFLELVHKRQSCRKYRPDPIPRDVLERCLESSRLAPSACNAQPWRFIVVETPAIKERLSEEAFSGIHSASSFASNAPILIAIVRENKSYISKLAGFFRNVKYSLIDIGISGEHFILQASEEGLGTCWIGWFNERGVKNVLGLSRDAKVDVLISLGYPLDVHVREKNRKKIEDVSQFV